MHKKLLVSVVFVFIGFITAWGQSFPYHESFESGTGIWTFEGSPTWTQWSGPTYSYDTGPAKAHDQDWYIYCEASVEGTGYPNVSMAMSATFDVTALSRPKLSFRYHMTGGAMGSLNVEVNKGAGWTSLFSRVGQQQSAVESDWLVGEVNLWGYSSDALQIRFTGITGRSYESDICIDDIWLYESDPMPARFEFEEFEERQEQGVTFPVTITAVSSSGTRLTDFNEAVELNARTAGYPDACKNGDFNEGSLEFWTEYPGAAPEGLTIANSVFGDGKAACFQPNNQDAGFSQDVVVRGGESYSVSAKYCIENRGLTDLNGSFRGRILLDGVDVATTSRSFLYRRSQYTYTLQRSFFVPNEDDGKTITISLDATAGADSHANAWVYFDDISVNFASASDLTASPGMTGTFVNGEWTGDVSMDYRLPAMSLIARYQDITGESGRFTTYVSAFDLDYDGMLDTWESLYSRCP